MDTGYKTSIATAAAPPNPFSDGRLEGAGASALRPSGCALSPQADIDDRQAGFGPMALERASTINETE